MSNNVMERKIIVRWVCPLARSYKCNTDGSSKYIIKCSSKAFCVRDRVEILKEKEVVIIHTFREDNNLADFLTNIVYGFVDTVMQFFSNEDMIIQARTMIQEDKQGLVELWLSLLVFLNNCSRLY
ncbi:hypothetical protein H5410_057245 [Solanum commersonii]|uniref:Uncharacterized protein n=1 Tax=Solanum commersonii TaxID=4109 RepID=A0A9J5WPI7_SOLCO|nr:hypothetical protein H5410_057245 [Solanum commersonii]